MFSGSCHDEHSIVPAVFHFGQLFEVHRWLTNEKYENQILERHPLLFLQICEFRDIDQVTPKGYASLQVPIKPGYYEIELPTWMPIADGDTGEIRSRLHDFYFGTSLNQFEMIKYHMVNDMATTQNYDVSRKVVDRSTIKTEASGTVRIRIQSVSSLDFTDNRSKKNSKNGDDLDNLDDILNEMGIDTAAASTEKEENGNKPHQY